MVCGGSVLLSDAVQTSLLHAMSLEITALSADVLRALGLAVVHREQVLVATAPPFQVSVENDCNGAWAHLILLASVLSYPASLQRKLAGLLVMEPLLFALNVVRVVSLFLIGLYQPSLFRATHVYIWQILIIGSALALFLVWVDGVAAREARDAA